MIWLGAAAVAVVLLYLLRPPARRFAVPSTLLWQRLLERTRKRRRWLRWLLSLLLSLLFVLLLVATLFRLEPRFGAVADPVILIDNTGSMGTRLAADPEMTRLDRARSLARTLLDQSSGAITVADLAGTFGPTTFQSLDEAARAIDRIQWRPGLDARLPNLFLRSTEQEQRAVYLLTDRPASWAGPDERTAAATRRSVPLGANWTLVDLSEDAHNIGFITLSSTHSQPGTLGAPAPSAFIELLNGGNQTQTTRLVVDVLTPDQLTRGAPQPARLLERDLEIAPRATWTGALDLSRAYALVEQRSPGQRVVLRASIEPGNADQQPADDVAWLVLDAGPLTIDGSRRTEVRRWPRWLTRVLETSGRLRVNTRATPGAVRILPNAPQGSDESDPAPCLALAYDGEPQEIAVDDVTLRLPGQPPVALPWTAVALRSAADAATIDPSSAWLRAQPSTAEAASIALVSAPDSESGREPGCVQWHFDPTVAHLETRPEFPALVESILLSVGARSTATTASGPERWIGDRWSSTSPDDPNPGANLMRDAEGLRATAPLGAPITLVATGAFTGQTDPPVIPRITPEEVARRAGSPWPRRSLLLVALAALLLFEAGTRFAGWTE